MFAIIGVVLLTLIFAWVSMYPLTFGLMAWAGFDEFNPLVGTIFLLIFAGIWIGWWFLVGTHIDISVGVR